MFVCVCVMQTQSVLGGEIMAHTAFFALSYVGSRSSSNMAIVEVNMLSGFSPKEGTNLLVSCFYLLHLTSSEGGASIIF